MKKLCLDCQQSIYYLSKRCRICHAKSRIGYPKKGGWKHSEDYRKHMSELYKGKAKSLGTRMKLREAALRRWQKPDELKKHSESQRRRFSNPENHPNWQGGITPIQLKLRTQEKYKKWRKNVFERDNYTCQECGDNQGGNLQAHHIKPFAYYPNVRYKLSNGVTLCKKCHKQTFKWMGKPKRGIYAIS